MYGAGLSTSIRELSLLSEKYYSTSATKIQGKFFCRHWKIFCERFSAKSRICHDKGQIST